ncbi:MAG: ankyrin repeat domain-containing protein [Pedobacter agri]
MEDLYDKVYDKFEELCISGNNMVEIEEYLKTYKFLINYDNGYFFDLIADRGNVELIKLFLKYGTDPTLDNDYALFSCAENENDECVDLLLKNGANFNRLKCNINYNYYLNKYFRGL